MKTTKNLALGLFIAASGIIFSSTAQAGATYVLMNQLAASTDCENIGMEGGLHKYKCVGKGTHEPTSGTFFGWDNKLTSKKVDVGGGYMMWCTFYVSRSHSGFFGQNTHHYISVSGGNTLSDCSHDVSISDNTFYAIVNLKAAVPSPELGGGLPDPSSY